MEARLNCELYREDGEEFRSVRLKISQTGLRISAQDMGTSVEKTWGCDDYEFWTEVLPTEFPKLLSALMRDRYNGQKDAVEAFKDFCMHEGVTHTWDSWL